MQAVKKLEEMLSQGWSVSMYMAHGGTNFGYMGGANIMDGLDAERGYVSLITSYDYSSPISEAGDHGYGSGDLEICCRIGCARKPMRACMSLCATLFVCILCVCLVWCLSICALISRYRAGVAASQRMAE